MTSPILGNLIMVIRVFLFYFRNVVEEVLKNGYKAVIYNERIVGPNPTVFILKIFFFITVIKWFFSIFFFGVR